MTNCQCMNCQTLLRWHTHNLEFLKDHPTLKESIEKEEARDRQILTCFNEKSAYEKKYGKKCDYRTSDKHTGVTDFEKFAKSEEVDEMSKEEFREAFGY